MNRHAVMAVAFGFALPLGAAEAGTPSASAVLLTHANSLATTETLDRAIEALVAAPSESSVQCHKSSEADLPGPMRTYPAGRGLNQGFRGGARGSARSRGAT